MNIKFIIIVFITSVLNFTVFGQDLLHSTYGPSKGYIYKLSDEQMKTFYLSKDKKFTDDFLTNRIDSFLLDSTYKKKLEPGFYIKQTISGNLSNYEFTYVPEYEVYILNNVTDLIVAIYDKNGNLIKDAKVKIKHQKLKFDKKISSYIIKKTNKKGLLEIEYKGNKSYFLINRQVNNPLVKRLLRPLNYVWYPIRYTFKNPLKYFRSYYWSFKFYQFTNFFEKFNLENRFSSYLVFNKPKYRPNDTVYFKAFITKRNGKRINKKVDVWLNSMYSSNKAIKLISLKPSLYKGDYVYSFILADSLNLTLDKKYSIKISKPNRKYKTFTSNNFYYEDYELKTINLKVRVPELEHYKDKEFAIYVKAVDFNGLNLPDAKVKITISTENISKTFANKLYCPYTLWINKPKLENLGETKIIIPNSIFPKANLTYKLNVSLKTSDNEWKKFKKTITRYYKKDEINTRLLGDSVEFYYKHNGIEMPVSIYMTTKTNFNKENFNFIYSKIKQNKNLKTLPFKLKIDQNIIEYYFLNDSISLSVKLPQTNFDIYGNKTKNSKTFFSNNPQKINFSYIIYKANKEIKRASTDSLFFTRKNKSRATFTIFAYYLWNGEIKTISRQLSPNKKRMIIHINQPSIIYPGQKVDFQIKITDNKNKALKDVDLTAYGLKSSMGANLPALPYYKLKNKTKGKKFYNSFNLKNNPSSNSQKLNYSKWNKLFNLDTIEYYKFMYPNSYYVNYIKIEDDKTEFAPFIVKDGALVPISYILQNGRPLFFSWAYLQTYSFNVSVHKNNVVEIRTTKSLIKMENVPLKKGYKLILSINYNSTNSNISFKKMPKKYTKDEQYLFDLYTMPYDDNFSNLAFLKQKSRLFLLSNLEINTGSHLTGPINSDSIFVTEIGKYKWEDNFEKGWKYIFEKNKLKLISPCNYSSFFPNYTSNKIYSSLTNRAITMKYIDKLIKQHKIEFRSKNYFNSNSDYSSKHNLNLQFIGDLPSIPLYNIILFNDKNIYNYTNLSNLNKNILPGEYNILLLYKDGYYQYYKTLTITPNSYFYYNIKADTNIYRSKSSIKLDSLMTNETTNHDAYWLLKEYNDLLLQITKNKVLPQKIKNYINSFSENNISLEQDPLSESSIFLKTGFSNSYVNISGTVYDLDMTPLPGVSVHMKGTNIATVTDMEGKYHLNNVNSNSILIFELIGMETASTIANARNINLMMQKKNVELTGVVITALGIARNYKTQSYTVQNVSSDIHLKNKLDKSDSNAIAKNNLKLDSIKKAEIQKIINPENDTLMQSSLRNNFKDYAYWNPLLRTDKNGIANFSVTFPDDITKWRTNIIAVSKNKLVNSKQNTIKSYKPIMGQVALPRFLVEDDYVKSIGKISNYTYDTINIKTQFFIDDSMKWQKNKRIEFSDIDKLEFYANTDKDSVKIKYLLTKDNGYFDGEERKIPILKQGIELAEGKFYILNKDTSITISKNDISGNISISAVTDIFDVYLYETHRVFIYKYYCNEQLSSKLIALLIEKKIETFKGIKFTKEREIKKIIKMLEKRRNSDELWGWWTNSKTSWWISLRVVEALMKAKDAGYSVNLNIDKISGKLLWLYDKSNYGAEIRILRILQYFNFDKIDYEQSSKQLLDSARTFNDSLLITKIQQKAGIKVNTDFIWKHKKETLYGNFYFTDNSTHQYVYNNNLINTVDVYEILKKENTDEKILLKIWNYFFEYRQYYCYWGNTYQTVRIIEALLPDFKENKKASPTKIVLSGNANKEISEFPYQDNLNLKDSITITKTGIYPVYLSVYKTKWVTEPNKNSKYFEINTSFPFGDVLFGGEKTIMNVKINVKKECEYVMVNVPIPAGCSYIKKPNSYWSNYIHAEYYKNRVTIFYEKMHPGNYNFNIELMPRYSGKYTLNPAKAELMYFPIFYGNNEIRKVDIK